MPASRPSDGPCAATADAAAAIVEAGDGDMAIEALQMWDACAGQ